MLLNKKVQTVYEENRNTIEEAKEQATLADPEHAIKNTSELSARTATLCKQDSIEENFLVTNNTFSYENTELSKNHDECHTALSKGSSNHEEELLERNNSRPCRFTQTEPLKYLPEKLPPLEPAFDQSKLRPHESILNCRYVDAFPDDTFAETYSKARLSLPFERMVYDKDEDFVVSVLFAEEGEHHWTSHIPCLVCTNFQVIYISIGHAYILF